MNLPSAQKLNNSGKDDARLVPFDCGINMMLGSRFLLPNYAPLRLVLKSVSSIVHISIVHGQGEGTTQMCSWQQRMKMYTGWSTQGGISQAVIKYNLCRYTVQSNKCARSAGFNREVERIGDTCISSTSEIDYLYSL